MNFLVVFTKETKNTFSDLDILEGNSLSLSVGVTQFNSNCPTWNITCELLERKSPNFDWTRCADFSVWEFTAIKHSVRLCWRFHHKSHEHVKTFSFRLRKRFINRCFSLAQHFIINFTRIKILLGDLLLPSNHLQKCFRLLSEEEHPKKLNCARESPGSTEQFISRRHRDSGFTLSSLSKHLFS